MSVYIFKRDSKSDLKLIDKLLGQIGPTNQPRSINGGNLKRPLWLELDVLPGLGSWPQTETALNNSIICFFNLIQFNLNWTFCPDLNLGHKLRRSNSRWTGMQVNFVGTYLKSNRSQDWKKGFWKSFLYRNDDWHVFPFDPTYVFCRRMFKKTSLSCPGNLFHGGSWHKVSGAHIKIMAKPQPSPIHLVLVDIFHFFLVTFCNI